MQTSTIQFMPKLSKASKMPCESFSLPAQNCKTGSKLAKIKGSVCHGCYALKGRYAMPNVKAPREHNLNLIETDIMQWRDNMVMMIKTTNASGFFRWHDSGDLQSFKHLMAIINIAEALPEIRFWLPTKEKALLNQLSRARVSVPDNLTIRLSMAMIDQAPQGNWVLTSTVHDKAEASGFTCKAPSQEGKCLTCRACWDKSITNVSYAKH